MLEGQKSMAVHWDLTKFFDTVVPARLVAVACDLNFPPHSLYLGLLIHVAPRMLESSVFCSDLISSGIGVLPGCMQSMSWVEVYLHQISHDVHHRYHPCVSIRTCVDDLSQVAQGSAGEVRRQLVSAA
eukprot:7796470-Pyramimonas_sp.AAC.1